MSVNEDLFGPPEEVLNRATERTSDGTISVGDDPLKQLANEIDWNNLSPFEEYVIAVLDENDLLPDE